MYNKERPRKQKGRKKCNLTNNPLLSTWGGTEDGGHLVSTLEAGQRAASGVFTGTSSNSAHQRCTLLKHAWMQQFNWKD